MVDLAREQGLVLMADHTYCYTPAVLKIRELIEAGELGEHPVRGLRPDQPRTGPARRRRLLGPRSARSVHPRLRPARRPPADRRLRARRRSARRGQGLCRLPEPAAARRRHGARPRELAEPHQDPADGDRRHPAHPGLGRPEPAATPERLRPRRRPGAPVGRHGRPDRRHDLLPSRRHVGPGPARARGPRRDGRPSSPTRSGTGASPRTDGDAGLRVLSVLEAAATSTASGGGARRPGHRRP